MPVEPAVLDIRETLERVRRLEVKFNTMDKKLDRLIRLLDTKAWKGALADKPATIIGTSVDG